MPGQDIATTTGSQALAIAADQTGWTDRQLVVLRHIGTEKATAADLELFFHVCARTGLDPFARQIYLAEYGGKPTIQTGIDGYRLIARRAADKAGHEYELEPTEWCGQDGVWRDVWLDPDNPPVAARTTVIRNGKRFPKTVLYSEYAGTKNLYENGRKVGTEINQMWRTKPASQLEKCFDSETEVLTEDGFKPFSLVGASRIMQVTPAGLEPVQAVPFAQLYDGQMVTYDSDDLNFSVTPNHDMVTDLGKVEAGAMYATSKSRPIWHIPRAAPPSTHLGVPFSDDEIRVAAAIVCDGTRASRGTEWRVEVSRPRKVAALQSYALHESSYVRHSKGSEAVASSGRVIRSNFDKAGFVYRPESTEWIIDSGKRIRPSVVMAMNSRQARVLVDALVFFDGTIAKRSGVRRFYTSDEHTLATFELAAAIAGYSVNVPTKRTSDISSKPGYCVTLSDRNFIPVVRRSDGGRSLELTRNADGLVWCVTVPSGQIVVRRRGFSMVCGNCAEAGALRKAFPHDLAGVYIAEEMQREHTIQGETVRDAGPIPGPGPAVEPILELIAAATTEDELRVIWAEHIPTIRSLDDRAQVTAAIHAARARVTAATQDAEDAILVDSEDAP